MTGTIKRLVADRGFGFIRSDEDQKDYFFHRSAVEDGFEMLHEGQLVEFEVDDENPKGPRAESVVGL